MNRAIIFFMSIVIFFMYAIISCVDLAEDSRSEVTDNYLNSISGFNDAVNAAYSHTRVYCENDILAHLTAMGTDIWSNGFDGGQHYLNYYNDNLNSRSGYFNSIWNRLYSGINTCNTAIDRASNVEGMDEGLINIRVAEVKFLRAQFYYLLVQMFGPIHLTLDETQGIQTEATRAPLSEIYETIINDLNDAIQNLPDIASEYGRATKPAAEHLLSKVYLTRAGSEAAQSSDYQNAADLAQRVIHNYHFRLLDDFGDVFLQGKENERHEEVVWAVLNSTDFQLNGGSDYGNGNSLHSMWLMKYDDLPGIARDIENGRPWARFRPTNYVKTTLFDKELDSRYEESFKRVFYANTPGTYTTVNGYEMTLSAGDTALYIVDEEWPEEKIEQAGYSVYTLSLHTDRVYPTLLKHNDPLRPSIPEMSGSRDFLVMRLAETYLIAAEALMMTGYANEALNYINEVRRRAAKQGANDAENEANKLAMEITSDQLNIDFILDERARELMGENMRWFDLVRTGKLVERVTMHNPDATGIQPHHVLRPIPQNQIDRSSTDFPQNPGY